VVWSEKGGLKPVLEASRLGKIIHRIKELNLKITFRNIRLAALPV